MLQSLYALIPSRIRETLSPVLSGFYLPVHCFTYPAALADDRLFAVYLGINRSRANLWGKRVLGDEYSHRQMGRAWIWSLETYLEKNIPDCNLIMVETNRLTGFLLARYQGFKIPMWFQFCLDLTRPLSEIKKSSTKFREQIPRLIRRNGLESEVSDSEEDLETFIDSMHIPYITGRHRETAFLTSRDDIRELFRNADLLFIKKEGKRISGVLVEYSENMAGTHYLGLKDNNPAYLKAGGVAALYYFAILHALDKGVQVFNMGATSPFLTDGVAFFKLTLKPYVTRVTYLGDYFVKLMLRKPSSGILEFLRHNPFLYVENGKHIKNGKHINRILFVDNSRPDFEEELQNLMARTHCGRLDRTVLALKDDTAAMRQKLKAGVRAEEKIDFASWDTLFNNKQQKD